MTADFDYKIEVLQATLKDLVFECPAELQPHEVMRVGPSCCPGSINLGISRGAPASSTCNCGNRSKDSSPAFASVASRPFRDTPWTAPSLILRNGTTRSEQIDVEAPC